MTKTIHVKWIGPNDPMIRIARNDARLYLTKRELFDLMSEIKEFVEFYNEDFKADTINNETPPEDYSVWANDYDKKNESTKA